MRRFFLASTLLGLVAFSAQAQEVIKAPVAAPSVVHIQDCGSCGTCKYCVAVPDKIKTSHNCYAMKCKDYCLPRCTHDMLRHNHGCNSGCNNGCATNGGSCSSCQDCEHRVRTKRVLYKKIVTCEEDTYRCEVAHRPAVCAPTCTTGRCHGGHCQPGCNSNGVIIVPAAPSTTPPAKMPPATTIFVPMPTAPETIVPVTPVPATTIIVPAPMAPTTTVPVSPVPVSPFPAATLGTPSTLLTPLPVAPPVTITPLP